MYDRIKSLDNQAWRNTSERVVDVRIDAYAEVNAVDMRILYKGTHWGFNAQLYRTGHPVLTVVGDYACYGVSPHENMFSERAWYDGYAEYELHNIDGMAQVVALHAGAGAFASMCEIETI
jgi:hypothetical protein